MRGALAVVFSSLPALLAIVADIEDRLDASAVSYFPSLDVAPEFDLKKRLVLLLVLGH